LEEAATILRQCELTQARQYYHWDWGLLLRGCLWTTRKRMWSHSIIPWSL